MNGYIAASPAAAAYRRQYGPRAGFMIEFLVALTYSGLALALLVSAHCGLSPKDTQQSGNVAH